MSRYALAPLDIQTEPLSREQQPSPAMVLVIALIAAAGVSLSWVAHQDGAATAVYPQGPHGPGGAQIVLAHR